MARVFGEFIDVVTATAEAKDQPVFTKATIEGWLAEIEAGTECGGFGVCMALSVIRAKMNGTDA